MSTLKVENLKIDNIVNCVFEEEVFNEHDGGYYTVTNKVEGKVVSLDDTGESDFPIMVETSLAAYEWYDYFEGLPLTEDWLIKLGFEKAVVIFTIKLNNSDLTIFKYQNDEYFLFYFNGVKELKIEYVHQVQNLVSAFKEL